MYYYKTAISNLFVKGTLDKIGEVDELWSLDCHGGASPDNQRHNDKKPGPLLDALYWQGIQTAASDDTQMAMVFEQSRLLGSPRLRMLKVHDRSCTVVKSFRREIQGCFGPYSESAEDRQPFGPANSSAFIYQTANKLETSSYWGAVSTYGGGGFVQYLTIDDRHASAHTISQLKANRWVDRGTRAIFIDFVLYNANINLFCISQYV
ncbi:unnamed protein product [Toxocara canis]|uniref:PKD_channel domain-containing protein n=1 Tax=Toxocara canis TaxID=6265 RepID=A0A183UP03_TOXCA|nr:unnamed protein product [Toxocara canis]